MSRIFDSVRHETRLSARLSETCIEALWVGLSLWVGTGTSDLPSERGGYVNWFGDSKDIIYQV